MTWADLVRIGLSLPRVEQSTSYGAPALKVVGKLFVCQPANAKLRAGGDIAVLFDVEPEERALLIEQEPEVFFFTDHYRDYPLVLARLSELEPERLRPYLERSWRRRAPKRLLKPG